LLIVPEFLVDVLLHTFPQLAHLIDGLPPTDVPQLQYNVIVVVALHLQVVVFVYLLCQLQLCAGLYGAVGGKLRVFEVVRYGLALQHLFLRLAFFFFGIEASH